MLPYPINFEIDSSKWPNGPWNEEEDLYAFRDKSTDWPCAIVRTPMGHLNGYVGIDSTHFLFGKDYDKANDKFDDSVHGGLTYSGKGDGNNFWWFGFDTAHYYDYVPGINIGGAINSDYRDVEYIKRELVNLCILLDNAE